MTWHNNIGQYLIKIGPVYMAQANVGIFWSILGYKQYWTRNATQIEDKIAMPLVHQLGFVP